MKLVELKDTHIHDKKKSFRIIMDYDEAFEVVYKDSMGDVLKSKEEPSTEIMFSSNHLSFSQPYIEVSGMTNHSHDDNVSIEDIMKYFNLGKQFEDMVNMVRHYE